MCGAFPSTLYKVLPDIYARTLLKQGEMMWSTLTYFQNDLDPTRSDVHEGSHRYFPVNGLDITRQMRNGIPDGAQFTLPEHGSQIKALKCHHILIYSTTLEPTLGIGDADTRACIEIFDPPKLFEHLRVSVAAHRSARLDRLIHDQVRYWSPTEPPGSIWAFPHLLAMHKHESYKAEREYRFAFGTRSDVFDFEQVVGVIVPPTYVFPKIPLRPEMHRMKLYLGNLEDCCRLFK
jgi:hypothetical protein